MSTILMIDTDTEPETDSDDVVGIDPQARAGYISASGRRVIA